MANHLFAHARLDIKTKRKIIPELRLRFYSHTHSRVSCWVFVLSFSTKFNCSSIIIKMKLSGYQISTYLNVRICSKHQQKIIANKNQHTIFIPAGILKKKEKIVAYSICYKRSKENCQTCK